MILMELRLRASEFSKTNKTVFSCSSSHLPRSRVRAHMQSSQREMRRACLLALALASSSADYWVDPAGSDANPGNVSTLPFATPQAALLASRTLPRPLTQDLFINIRAGVYALNSTLALLPGDGGDGSSARFIWRRSPDSPTAAGPAVLSGGAALSFAPAPGRAAGILSAPLPVGLSLNRSRQLFIGGVRRWPARVPAAPPGAVDWATSLANDAYTMHYNSSLSGCGFKPASCYPSTCPAGDAWGFVYDRADARGPHTSWMTQGGAVDIQTFGSWTSGMASLAKIFPGNATLLTAAPLPSSPGQFGGRGCPSGARWVAHNVEEALVPGSGTFYVDDSARVIFYAPTADEDPAALDAVMPVLDTIISITGDDCGGPIAWAAFQDLNISFATDGGARLGAHGASAPTAAITVAATLQFNLTRLSVQHVGGNGIALLATSRAITVDSCEVRDAGGDGLGAYPGQTDSNVDTTITNNVVEAVGRIFLVQPAGLRIMGSGDEGVTTVAHNLVRDTPYGGIMVGWHTGEPRPSPAPAPWRYNISHNVAEDIGRGVLNDFGGIYVSMGAPGYKCQDTDSCWIPTLVENNVVRRVTAYNWAGNGAYTDENVAGVSFSRNVFAGVDHVALYFHCGFNLTADNNILFDGDASQAPTGQTGLFGSCNTGGVAPAEANISASVTRNVMVVVGARSTVFDSGELVPTANMTFDSNTYWASGGAQPPTFPPSNSRTFAQWQAAGEDAHSGVDDPLITQPSTSDNADWTLLPGSPALARGFQNIDLSQVGPQTL